MITQLRSHIEDSLNLPVHLVHITGLESLPCATIRQSSYDHDSGLTKTPHRRLTVELALWDTSYVDIEDITEDIFDIYNYKTITLDTWTANTYVNDVQDDSFPSSDGSDDWIYSKEITINIHAKKI